MKTNSKKAKLSIKRARGGVPVRSGVRAGDPNVHKT
jgi:hypothetical protein